MVVVDSPNVPGALMTPEGLFAVPAVDQYVRHTFLNVYHFSLIVQLNSVIFLLQLIALHIRTKAKGNNRQNLPDLISPIIYSARYATTF